MYVRDRSLALDPYSNLLPKPRRRFAAARGFARRMATNTLVINVDIAETRVALIEQGNLAELFLEREQDRSPVGNVYLGKVTRVLPGMQAAFVDIGLDRAAFLHVEDVVVQEDMDSCSPTKRTAESRAGDDERRSRRQRRRAHAQAQARARSAARRRSARSSKKARRSSSRSRRSRSAPRARASRATSRCPAATSCTCRRSITSASPSASAPSKERARLREAIEAMKPPQRRPHRAHRRRGPHEEAAQGRRRLPRPPLGRGRARSARAASAPALLYERARSRAARPRAISSPTTSRRSSSTTREQYERLRALRRDVHARARRRTSSSTRATSRSSTRTASRTRSRARSSRKVPLPSGGYLIIDQAEALTAIDVNTGRFVGKGSKDLEETILKTNLEAVEEIAYQLRFRNIGGLIILDLIDMERPQQPREGATQRSSELLAEGQGQDDAQPHQRARPHRDDAQAHAREPRPHAATSRASTATAPGSCSRSRRSPTRSCARSAASGTTLPGYTIIVNAHPAVVDMLQREREGRGRGGRERASCAGSSSSPRKEYHLEQFDLQG